MAGKNTAVFGIYHDRQQTEQALDALRVAGFRNSDVSALLPDNVGTKDFAHEKNTKVPEGTATGGTSGAVVGGALGWLGASAPSPYRESDRLSRRVRLWERLPG